MEEYMNPTDPELVETDEVQDEAEEVLFEEPAPEPEIEEQKPKKKKMTFKRKLKRALRRFFKLPLLTRCIALGAVVIILIAIIVLLVVLPKNCKNEANAGKNLEVTASAEPTEEPTDEIKQVEPTREPVPTATAIPTLPSTPLKLNDRDAIIPYIRLRLVELGYMEMPATNDELYDQATFNAVKRFQYRNFPDNVKDWDGYIGQKTYDKMFATDVRAFYIKSGDTDAKLYDGELVTRMQRQLIALGYLKSTTGSCDKATVDAIRSFQKKNSLTSDGVAGLSTLNLLKQMTLELEASPAATDTAPVPADTAEQQPAESSNP